jgi:predicted MFS family arabinose efflux permease
MAHRRTMLRKALLYPWACWVIVALFFCFQYGLLIMPSVFSAELQSSLAINMTQVGVVYSAFLYTYVAMQIPVGLIYDRFPARYVLFFATMIVVLGGLLMAIASNYATAIVARMIMGFGGSFAFIGCLCIGRNWFPIVFFPIIVGLTESMMGFSEVVLMPTMAYLQKYQYYRVLLLELTFVLVVLAVLIFIFVRDRHPERKKRANHSLLDSLRYTVTKPIIWLLGFYVGFVSSFNMVIANMWGVPLLSDYYNIPTWKAAVETSMIMIGFIIGAFCVGMLARYIQDRKLMLWFSVVQFVVMLFFWYFHVGLFVAGIMLFIIGFTASSVVLTFDLVKKIVPQSHYGCASGFINVFFGGMGIILSPIVGHIYGVTKNDANAFIPVLICSGLGLLVVLVLQRMRIRQLPNTSQGFVETAVPPLTHV